MKENIETKNWFKIPNLLSLYRFVSGLAILFFIFLKVEVNFVRIIFILAVLTDFLDGLSARVLKMQTRLGKMLEPLADTLLTYAAILYGLAHLNFPIVFAIYAFLIFFLGFFATLMIRLKKKEWFAQKIISCEISATLIYLCAIMYFFNVPYTFYLLIVTAIISFISFLDYLRHLFIFAKSQPKL